MAPIRSTPAWIFGIMLIAACDHCIRDRIDGIQSATCKVCDIADRRNRIELSPPSQRRQSDRPVQQCQRTLLRQSRCARHIQGCKGPCTPRDRCAPLKPDQADIAQLPSGTVPFLDTKQRTVVMLPAFFVASEGRWWRIVM
jgi:hypothetical protein